MVLHGLLAAALWAALVLTPLALAKRTWPWLFAAAILSLTFSIAAVFSIGFLIVLLTCVQLAGALGLKFRVGWRGWVALPLLAILVWTIAIPGQLAVGRTLPLIAVLPLALLGAILVLVLGPLVRRRLPRHR